MNDNEKMMSISVRTPEATHIEFRKCCRRNDMTMHQVIKKFMISSIQLGKPALIDEMEEHALEEYEIEEVSPAVN